MVDFQAPGQKDWYLHPMDSRAARSGEFGLNGRPYAGGEFMPHYVPRPIMPQVDEADMPALIEFLKAKGIVIREDEFDPHACKTEQRVDLAKVKGLTADNPIMLKPILVSMEPTVLDGNHRLAAHKIFGTKVKAIVLELAFEAAIAAIFEFPKTYAYGDGQPHAEAN